MNYMKYTFLEWPSQTPGLSMTENLRGYLEHAARARRPENISGLKGFCKEKQEQLHSYVIQSVTYVCREPDNPKSNDREKL